MLTQKLKEDNKPRQQQIAEEARQIFRQNPQRRYCCVIINSNMGNPYYDLYIVKSA